MHMFNSRVFRSLLPPLAAVMFLSLFVGLYETLLKVWAAVHYDAPMHVQV